MQITIGIIVGMLISVLSDLYAIRQIRRRKWTLEIRDKDGNFIRNLI